eukprot:scpid106881/ scgid31514/ 
MSLATGRFSMTSLQDGEQQATDAAVSFLDTSCNRLHACLRPMTLILANLSSTLKHYPSPQLQAPADPSSEQCIRFRSDAKSAAVTPPHPLQYHRQHTVAFTCQM